MYFWIETWGKKVFYFELNVFVSDVGTPTKMKISKWYH